MGYHVISLNLKGLTDAHSALKMFSREFIADVNNMNDENFSCVYVELLCCPAIKNHEVCFCSDLLTIHSTCT